MKALSKSKLVAFRQCRRRLWLEVHRPELREDSAATQASFQVGYQVGDIARQIYDPKMRGTLVEIASEGIEAAFRKTRDALQFHQPIFEAGFTAAGALAFADVLVPARRGGRSVWRMIEIKSSTSVKDYHRDDIAIQAFVARESGLDLASISIAHIDSSFTYGGNGDYRGILIENDLSDEAFERRGEVVSWIADAQHVINGTVEPDISTGRHCNEPFACGFHGHCRAKEPQPLYSASLLPRIQAKALKACLEHNSALELADVPDELLNARQLRVKTHTLSGTCFFDKAAASTELAAYRLPAYFLDFETIQFPVPIWKGTRPYQQIPFQFSLHRLSRNGALEHFDFLDLSGNDPSKAFATQLVAACGASGPIYVYNAGFETARMRELAERFPSLRTPLLAIIARVVDLLRTAERHYYHPAQKGSWSIKAVLPTIVPNLRYDTLEGVQDGGMAMNAFMEAISPETGSERKQTLHSQLSKYCQLDTYALVRMWQTFSGQSHLTL